MSAGWGGPPGIHPKSPCKSPAEPCEPRTSALAMIRFCLANDHASMHELSVLACGDGAGPHVIFHMAQFCRLLAAASIPVPVDVSPADMCPQLSFPDEPFLGARLAEAQLANAVLAVPEVASLYTPLLCQICHGPLGYYAASVARLVSPDSAGTMLERMLADTRPEPMIEVLSEYRRPS